jgi:hypothetical protein
VRPGGTADLAASAVMDEWTIHLHFGFTPMLDGIIIFEHACVCFELGKRSLHNWSLQWA